jgi:Protein of unknown function (DUF3592)
MRTGRWLAALRWLLALALLAAGVWLGYLPFKRAHDQDRHAAWLQRAGDRVQATVMVDRVYQHQGRSGSGIEYRYSVVYDYADGRHTGGLSCDQPCPAANAVVWIRVNPADPGDFAPESNTLAADDEGSKDPVAILVLAGIGLLALGFVIASWPLWRPDRVPAGDGPDVADEPADEPAVIAPHPRGAWVVWRRDRHGNESVVAHRRSRTAARTLANQLTTRNRQQTYWIATDR